MRNMLWVGGGWNRVGRASLARVLSSSVVRVRSFRFVRESFRFVRLRLRAGDSYRTLASSISVGAFGCGRICMLFTS